MELYPLILVCGPTAAGKTAVVEAAVERLSGLLTIIPTTTTRPPRESELLNGTAWYKFAASRAEAQAIIDQGAAINWAEFDDNLYISSHHDVDEILSRTCGVQIVVEQSVTTFCRAGYDVVSINLLPKNAPPNPRAHARAEKDRTRQGSIRYNYLLINDFDRGGQPGPKFETTVERLCDIIRRLH